MKIFLLYLNIGLAISIIELVFLKNEQKSKETIEKNERFSKYWWDIIIILLSIICISFNDTFSTNNVYYKNYQYNNQIN